MTRPLHGTLKASISALGAYCALALAAADSSHLPARRQSSFLSSPVSVALADVSGTRLKASYVLGADGSKLFDATAMYDSQLDLKCGFGTAADGVVRCIPMVSPSSQKKSILFSDNACTKPVAYFNSPPAGCTLTPSTYVYGYVGPFPACPYSSPEAEPIHAYTVGAAVPGLTQAYSIGGTGACSSQSAPGGVAFALTEMSPSTFATGTLQHDP